MLCLNVTVSEGNQRHCKREMLIILLVLSYELCQSNSYNSIWRIVHQLHLLRDNERVSFVCLTYGLSHKHALYDYHFLQINSFLFLFYTFLNSSDMIVHRLFRRQFFTHSVTHPTRPSKFHVTIRCCISSILQSAIFYPYSGLRQRMEAPYLRHIELYKLI